MLSSKSISEPDMDDMSTRHRALWLLVLTGWVFIGLTFTLNYYLFADHYVAIFRQQPTFGEMLIWELPYWLLWAALSPVVFWIMRRFRIERGRRLSSALVYTAACLLLSGVHRAIYLILGWVLHVTVFRQQASIPELYSFLFFFNLPTGFMSYGTILLVSYVVDYYNRYQQEELKAERLKAELARAELQVTEAQLQALKMQLQPHFLFNTLNSISSLLEEDPHAADEMLARLGDFLRLTLQNSGAQEVTLQEEIEFLRCYLEIEKVRFQDRLTVDLRIDRDALDALVPNLILQPIVENAIRHGIVSQIAPGQIEVRASRCDGSLEMRVIDNGPGLAASGKLREGVGLANTRARLKQLYGDSFILELRDAPDGGSQALVRIPFKVLSGERVEKAVAI
jgi:two-component system, LytTR family, sensor kinase